MVEKNDKDQFVALNVNLRGMEQTQQPLTLANYSTVRLAGEYAEEYGMTWLNRSTLVVTLLLGGNGACHSDRLAPHQP